MMNINAIFASMIATTNLSIDNDRLEQYCQRNFTQPNSRGQQCWLDINDSNLKELKNEVTRNLNWLHTELGFSDDWKQEITQCWANINNSESIGDPHCHVGSFFNAVYYLKANETNSQLVLMSPVSELDHIVKKETIKKYTPFNASGQSIKPHTGLLVIMPGWLKHYVKNDDSPLDRISIVFDSIMVKN